MIVPTKTFIPFEQFDIDIILKVMAAILNLDLADLNCGTIFHKQVIKLY